MEQTSDQAGANVTSATAVARANIALVKYWGKRSEKLNLPAVGSISLTLDALKTKTTICFDTMLQKDHIELNGEAAPARTFRRITRFLDLVGSKQRPRAHMKSTNNFPTSAGLASSASGFAALALSASRALGQHLSKRKLSKLARRGSGSAARSIYGGFTEMKCGNTPDGGEDYAIPLFDKEYWDIRMLIAVTSTEKKAIGSTEGMNHTAKTSPYFKSWVESQPYDLTEMRSAIRGRDFEKTGELAEYSSFKMHALAMSARPALHYWNAATMEAIHIIRSLRQQGTAAYMTIDAGPQLKVLCLPEAVDSVRQALKTVGGVSKILECGPGAGAAVTSLERA